MHRIKIFIFMAVLSSTMMIRCKFENQNILVCYGDFYPQKIKNYNYIVIEPSLFSKTDVAILKNQNDFVMAYISLGEVNEGASHFEKIKNETIGKNENWNSYILDLNAKNTNKTLHYLIDKHLKTKDFDGLFLDNIDNYTKYGPTPEKKEKLVYFLDSIKNKYPDKLLIQNAGLLILEDTHKFIDVVAIESIATNYDFKNNKYQLRNLKEFEKLIAEIETKQAQYNIPFFLIEYANNKKLKDQISERLKNRNVSYFISEIDLQKLPKTEN